MSEACAAVVKMWHVLERLKERPQQEKVAGLPAASGREALWVERWLANVIDFLLQIGAAQVSHLLQWCQEGTMCSLPVLACQLFLLQWP